MEASAALGQRGANAGGAKAALKRVVIVRVWRLDYVPSPWWIR